MFGFSAQRHYHDAQVPWHTDSSRRIASGNNRSFACGSSIVGFDESYHSNGYRTFQDYVSERKQVASCTRVSCTDLSTSMMFRPTTQTRTIPLSEQGASYGTGPVKRRANHFDAPFNVINTKFSNSQSQDYEDEYMGPMLPMDESSVEFGAGGSQGQSSQQSFEGVRFDEANGQWVGMGGVDAQY
ncbi:hypothetical protein J8273_0047 [Carpediemonas membranifera]|uniref:Uncharacterized protein n=1 Tax=Carpediemonas membranifera TaxID=201153 RepID=A0A8J6EAK9_9EUKA|nr:hypothetical protein J8273_0047 [Carpediemonas membranifera]|eukprot:KAG9394840.1 hypothetical protein J8273_0047 [Carpediemonas membranifera]